MACACRAWPAGCWPSASPRPWRRTLAHGWSHGPIGAAVAAWPAASLVGSYELLLWLIRTASASAAARVPLVPDQTHIAADHHAAELRLVTPTTDPHAVTSASVNHLMPNGFASSAGLTSLTSGPERSALGEAYQNAADCGPAVGQPADPGDSEEKVNAAAVAAYRTSIDNGKPISERRLAAMFRQVLTPLGTSPHGRGPPHSRHRSRRHGIDDQGARSAVQAA